MPGRTFRILVAALHIVESEFLVRVESLADPAHWADLPVADQHMTMQSLIFRMLSRAGSTIDTLVRYPHTVFPVKFFTFLEDEELAGFLSCTPGCVLGMLAADFIQTFPMSEADSRAALRFIASFIHTDISQIEQRHAILRRRPHVMPPTNRPTVGDSSAEWTMRQHRARRGKLTHGGRSKKVATEKKEKKRKQRTDKAASLQPKLRKSGKGGAWRAFTREQTFGIPGKHDFKVLARAFRALPADERARLSQKRQARDSSGQAGRHTFRLELKSNRSQGSKAAEEISD